MNEKTVESAKRYFSYLNKFYNNDLVKTIGKYDIFYKKLLIAYQFKALLKGLKTAKIINEIIKKEFPNAIGILDYYLYPLLAFEFLRRIMYGKMLSFRHKDLFL